MNTLSKIKQYFLSTALIALGFFSLTACGSHGNIGNQVNSASDASSDAYEHKYGSGSNGYGSIVSGGSPNIKTTNHLYVSTSGNNANTCKSISSSCRTIQHAVDLAKPSTTIYVKAGNYGAEHIIIRNKNSTPNKPIILEGYKNTPGDNPKHPDASDPAKALNIKVNAKYMPLLDGGNYTGNGITIYNVEGITIKNFQLKRYANGILYDGTSIWEKYNKTKNARGIHYENCISRDMSSLTVEGGANFAINRADYSSINNCIGVNATHISFQILGHHNELSHNKSYSTFHRQDGSITPNNRTGRQDYHVDILGHHNKIHHNYIETEFMQNGKSINIGHWGHGIAISTEKWTEWGNKPTTDLSDTHDNEIYNNKIVGVDRGIEFRYGVNKNYMHDNEVIDTIYPIRVADGSSRNRIENITIESLHNMYYGDDLPRTYQAITISADGANTTYSSINYNNNNTFKNITINRAVYGIKVSTLQNSGVVMGVKNNTFSNIKVNTIVREMLIFTSEKGGTLDSSDNTIDFTQLDNINKMGSIRGFSY